MLLSVPGKVLNRVILDRLKTGVDAKLRDHQAGFRKDLSCTDQIATQRIIVEQSMEWDSSLYINFVDYEKAFDSLDRDTLWKLLQHYGIPNKLISLIRNSYEDMACRQDHSCRTTYRLLHGEDRSEVRMSSVTILIPARHRLDHEKDYNK